MTAGDALPASADAGTWAPELSFTVSGAEVMRFSAVPALRFRIGISRFGGGPISSVTLTAEVRVAAPRRRYRPEERDRLAELFGTPEQWSRSLRPLPWTRATVVVPPFTDSTAVELPVACDQDVELAVTKYFLAVGDGDVPLDFLFSGTVFHLDADQRLRASRISWSSDTTFRLPGRVWHEAVDGSSPGHRWLRVSTGTYDRLGAHRRQRGLPDWDAAINTLLNDGIGGEHDRLE